MMLARSRAGACALRFAHECEQMPLVSAAAAISAALLYGGAGVETILGPAGVDGFDHDERARARQTDRYSAQSSRSAVRLESLELADYGDSRTLSHVLRF